MFKLHSHLWEHLLLNILHTFLQGDQFGSEPVNHLVVFLPANLQGLDLLSLTLHLPNKVIDHVGQLVNLDVLHINSVVQLIYDLPYTIGCLSYKINMFIQMIDGMVLSAIQLINLIGQHVDLGQQLYPNRGGILGVPLTGHLTLPSFQFEESLF